MAIAPTWLGAPWLGALRKADTAVHHVPQQCHPDAEPVAILQLHPQQVN